MAKKRHKLDYGKLDSDIESIDAEIKRFKEHVKKGTKPLPLKLKLPSATSVEEVVEKEEMFAKRSLFEGNNLAPLAFYFLTSLACVGILAFLFGSIKTFVFYFAFGLFLWWWSHQFHREQSHMMVPFFSLGSLIVFLYVFYWIFNDALSILICLIYGLSFFIAGVLYLYHVKGGIYGEIHRSFARTFLVMFYSHIIAFSVASLLAYLIPGMILGDSFVSMSFLIVIWIFPSLLVYFFLTKFLYPRFFDMVHIKRDLLKGFVHGAVYSIVFLLLLLIAYILTAIQFVGMESEGYEDTFSEMFTKLHGVKTDIDAIPFEYETAELKQWQVTYDVLGLSERMLQNATALNARLDRRALAFDDYFSDNYFTILAKDRMAVARTAVIADEISELNADLIREYRRVKRFEDSGSYAGHATLEGYGSFVKEYVNSAYVPYELPVDVASMKRDLIGSVDSYDALIGNGKILEFNLVYNPDLAILDAGDSRFSRQVYDTFYHTVIFRDLMLIIFDSMIFNIEETADPYAVNSLYSLAGEETIGSSALRYAVIKSNIDATISISTD